MTYQEYSKAESKYSAAISLKRSLLMTIRMNDTWQFNVKSIRGMKRQAVIDAAKARLAQLVIPPKPVQPIGYEIIVEGSFEGFVNSDDAAAVQLQVEESLGHSNFTLVTKLRFND